MLHSYDFSWTLQACQVAKHISCLHHLILLITSKSTLQHSTKYLMSWNAVSYNPPSRLFWSFQTSAALSRSLILWKVGKLSYLFHSLILAIADGKKFASPPLSQSIRTLDRSLSIMVIYVNETLWLKKKPVSLPVAHSDSKFKFRIQNLLKMSAERTCSSSSTWNPKSGCKSCRKNSHLQPDFLAKGFSNETAADQNAYLSHKQRKNFRNFVRKSVPRGGATFALKLSVAIAALY